MIDRGMAGPSRAATRAVRWTRGAAGRGIIEGGRWLSTLSAALLMTSTLIAAPVAGAAEVILPPYPWVANETFVVDEAAVEARAQTYCAAEGAAADGVDFYFGYLPQRAFDDLCLADAPQIDALLGDLYVSGYFGGLWLRDALSGAPREAAGALPIPGGARGGALDAAVIRALARAAGGQVDRASAGGDGEVVLASRAALPPLLELYGYNLGYIEVVLEHPPAGVTPQVGALSCGEGFLDCGSDANDLAVLEALSPALGSIASPPGPRWRRVGALVDRYGIPAVEDGAAVWEDILAEDDLSAAAYLPLIDVSVGFLMVTEAAVLAAATAWGDGDPAAARCGLLLEAGLTVWSGSYFMGLASDDPPGTFPGLSCP